MNRSPFEPVYDHVVPFHDCDPLRIVWHGNYYKYFEHAREAFLRARRLDVRDFEELGLAMVVIESRCRYVSPLRHGEQFAVSVRAVDIEQRVHLAYEIRAGGDYAKHSHAKVASSAEERSEDRRIARGWTTLVVTKNNEMLMETPFEVQRRLADPA